MERNDNSLTFIVGHNQNNQLKAIGTVYGNWGGNGNIKDRYDSDNSNISDNDNDNISHKDNNTNIKSNIKIMNNNAHSNTNNYSIVISNSNNINLTSRSSHFQMFLKTGVLKIFAIFTGNYLCWSFFLIKLQA